MTYRSQHLHPAALSGLPEEPGHVEEAGLESEHVADPLECDCIIISYLINLNRTQCVALTW